MDENKLFGIHKRFLFRRVIVNLKRNSAKTPKHAPDEALTQNQSIKVSFLVNPNKTPKIRSKWASSLNSSEILTKKFTRFTHFQIELLYSTLYTYIILYIFLSIYYNSF